MALLFPAPDDPGEPSDNVDYRIDSLPLKSTNRSVRPVDISESIATSGMTLSVDQSNPEEFTVGVLDPDRHLLTGDLLTGWTWGTNADDRDETRWVLDGRTITAQIGDLDLQLVKVSKDSAGDVITLTLEQEAVLALKSHRGARKVFRDSGFTRAEFVKMLADAAGVPVYIPELHKPQPRARSTAISPSERRTLGKRGLDPSANLGLNATQRQNAEIALDEADKLNAPELAFLALIEACIVEPAGFHGSGPFDNPRGGDSTSKGILQLLASTAAGLHVNPMDVKAVVHLFLTRGFYGHGGAIENARRHPGKSAGQIAQETQGSAFPSRYSQHEEQAKRILHAYRPGISGSELTVEVVKPYAFRRGKSESSWAAIQRLAQEVQWRAFVRKGVLWYASEEWLFGQKPQIAVREPRYAQLHGLSPNGVTGVGFDVDLGARDLVAELTVTARASLWTALPGMVVSVRGTGPADGRWIVGSVEKDDLRSEATDATIICHKPLPAKPEPANERETVSVSLGTHGTVKASNLRHMSPKAIIDNFVLPVGRKHGLRAANGGALTAANVTAANRQHGPTVNGTRSDHQGPPSFAWAADMSNGYNTPAEERCAEELARIFDIPYKSSGGAFNRNAHGFRFQLIHRSMIGGNHYNHVHFGVKKL